MSVSERLYQPDTIWKHLQNKILDDQVKSVSVSEDDLCIWHMASPEISQKYEVRVVLLALFHFFT